ncbi:MAG: type II secretion system protein [Succinivibrionaceae bacterium]|nr:type II secretion system protein [Succinivibrionaceae bacterium]
MIKKVRGFTLIEIIIGIVVLSIALTGGLSLLISQVDAYRDPLIKEKSVQIAKRVVHEIQIRAYDDVDDFDTAKLCPNLSGSYSCSDNKYLPVVYFFSDAADEATQKKYNDYYAGFLVKIEVVPATISGDADSAKKITVTVRQSDGLEIEYSFIKANI